MTMLKKPLYVPAVRMKSGELLGARDLSNGIADQILPRMIVPPRGERDDELQQKLFASETFPDISRALVTHWGQRPVLIEISYLLDEFDRTRMKNWLPRMFESAREAEARPIPLVRANDILIGDINAYKASIDNRSTIQFGIVFDYDDLADDEIARQVVAMIERMGISPNNCVAIADFQGADFSNPALVSPIIESVLETLHSSAPWQLLVFQGTNFPEKNPAPPNSHFLVPRNEWVAWRSAVKFNPQTADFMIFGDYVADCAKINFKSKGGSMPIRHHRYTTPDSWWVERGADTGSHATNMKKVCENILKSGTFSGRSFSSADDQIFRIANGISKSGGAKEWRAVNTTHHITRVVTDIAAIRGVTIEKEEAQPHEEQFELIK